MAYLVLARKYRPRQFADIIGQAHVVRTLENAIRLNRVHHAFLFTGARGVGKTTMARVLARALSCMQGPTITPCGTCAVCMEISSGASSDVLEIDGASNTGVDHVRELRENARYLPSNGRYKLYIIDEVHMLSQAAFNALLKIIEEPPAHVKFILATTEPHKIPATILSRCQRFDFRRVSPQVLTEHLRSILTQEGMTLGAAALAAVVRQAEGSVRDALSLLDQILSYADGSISDAAVLDALGVIDRQIVFALFAAMVRKDAKDVLGLIAQVDSRGHDLSDLAGLLVEHVRDVLVAKTLADPTDALASRSPEEITALQQHAADVSAIDIHRMFSVTTQVAEDVARSPHARVSLEMGILRVLEIEPATSLRDVIARLDRLAAGGVATAVATPVSVPKPLAMPLASSAPVPAPASTATPLSAPMARVSPAPVQQSSTASSPTPSAVPEATESMDEATWRRVIDRVRALQPAIASIWEHGRVLQWNGETLVVGYAPGSFYLDAARDPDNRGSLLTALTEIFRRSVHVTVQALVAGSNSHAGHVDAQPQGLQSLADLNIRAKEQHNEQVCAEAISHPTVREALAVLGAEVTQVIPLAEL